MKHFLLVTAAINAAVAGAAPAEAGTLRQALVGTYQNNPTLNAQRESLQGTDATVAIARAAGRPQVSAIVGLNRDLTRSGVLDSGRSKGPTVSGGVDLNLPLFNGGRVRHSVEAARTRVEAARATLRAVEGDVFTESVAAYMDVIRDRAINELNENQIRVLTTNLEWIRQGYESGDLTRTDVAQSESRLSLARSQLAGAQARLAASEENFRRIIGWRPDDLSPPPPLPPFPATADEAVRIALVQNPDVIAGVQQARAAGSDVRIAHAERLPSVSGVLSGDYVKSINGNDGFGIPRSGTQTSIGVNSRIPLYQGGAPAARLRQSQALEGQLLEQTIGTERAVVASTRSIFASFEAAQQAIIFNKVAVGASELALEGARVERSVGTRTVIDVLNAEQELLSSQVQLVSARRDAYVAGFQLLNAMGQAEADDLGLDGGPLYDPTANYRKTANKWSDWASEPRHQVRSTRTVTPTELSLAEPRGALAVSSVEIPKVANLAPVAQDVKKAEVETTVPPPAGPTVAKLAPVAQDVRQADVEATLPPPTGKGGWQVQLGAFRMAGAPQALYARLSNQLGGKQPTYHRFGSLTRLVVGPYDTKAEALAACRNFTHQQGCFPVFSNEPN